MRRARWIGGAVLLVAAVSCGGGGDIAQQVTSETQSQAAPKAADAKTQDPWRVWWRRGERGTTPYVARTPGGDAIDGEWKAGYFCSMDGRPSWLWPYGAAPPRLTYSGHWVFVEHGGSEWWLFTRRASGPDPEFSDEERALIGRWRHFESENRFEREIELLDDGTARTPDGERWEWIAGGRCIEFRRPLGGNHWLVLNCTLSEDGRSYARDDDVKGARLGR